MTVVENANPVSSDTPRVMLLTSDVGLPVEKNTLFRGVIGLKHELQ